MKKNFVITMLLAVSGLAQNNSTAETDGTTPASTEPVLLDEQPDGNPED